MDANVLQTGADDQIHEFKKAQAKGQAYVHQDFNLVSEGDLIQEEGIPTGELVKKVCLVIMEGAANLTEKDLALVASQSS